MTLTPDEAAVERVARAIADEQLRQSRARTVDARATARAALAAAAPAPGDAWEDISTAPRDGCTIQVYRYLKPWHVVGYARWVNVAGITGWMSFGYSDPPGNLGLGSPTHWQPLPLPPAELSRRAQGAGA